MTPWKRFSAAELEELRCRCFGETPCSLSIDEAQRLLNERDALEHALQWSKDGQRAKLEFLAMMEHCSQMQDEITRLRTELARYEAPLGAVI